MKFIVALLVISIQCLIISQAEEPLLPNEIPEYLELEKQYKAALEKQRNLTIEPKNKLLGFYKKKMSGLQRRFQNSGDLKRAVAAQAAAAEPIEEKVNKDFDEIASVQKIFLKEKQKSSRKTSKSKS